MFVSDHFRDAFWFFEMQDFALFPLSKILGRKTRCSMYHFAREKVKSFNMDPFPQNLSSCIIIKGIEKQKTKLKPGCLIAKKFPLVITAIKSIAPRGPSRRYGKAFRRASQLQWNPQPFSLSISPSRLLWMLFYAIPRAVLASDPTAVTLKGNFYIWHPVVLWCKKHRSLYISCVHVQRPSIRQAAGLLLPLIVILNG